MKLEHCPGAFDHYFLIAITINIATLTESRNAAPEGRSCGFFSPMRKTPNDHSYYSVTAHRATAGL